MKCNKRQCKSPAKFEILYNAGTTKQKLTLCQRHLDSDPVFKLNIKTIKEVKE